MGGRALIKNSVCHVKHDRPGSAGCLSLITDDQIRSTYLAVIKSLSSN